MFVSAKWILAMLRWTMFQGRPLVQLRVSMYCCADCVCPWSPSGSVPLRKCSPAFADISISSAQVNFFKAARADSIFARSRRTMPALTLERTAFTSPVLWSFTSNLSRDS